MQGSDVLLTQFQRMALSPAGIASILKKVPFLTSVST